MKKRVIAILSLFLIAIFSLLLFGCKKETIKFYRESAVSKAMNSFTEEKTYKDSVKKSSGVFIYKDTSYQNNNKGTHFGPADLNFDLQIRIK
jgi:uncharacterized protein YxeA